MRAPTTVLVPFLDEAELLTSLLGRLSGERRERVRVVLMDNGSSPETIEAVRPRVEEAPGTILVGTQGLGLYAMWRFGWRTAAAAARDMGSREWEVAFLNSDVDVLPGTITQLREALRDERLGACCPDYTRRVREGRDAQRVDRVTGSYRHGGLAGWCFMVRGELEELGVQPDPDFEWWAGDDDLFFQVEAAGWDLGIVRGLPVDHVGEATARHHPWTEEAKGRDMARLAEKWGPR